MSVIQFKIPKTAADAVDIGTIKPRGRAAGVADVRFGYNDNNGSHGSLRGRIRITCSIPMAIFLVEQLRQRALVAGDAGTPEGGAIVVACTEAVAAAFKELEAADRRHRAAP